MSGLDQGLQFGLWHRFVFRIGTRVEFVDLMLAGRVRFCALFQVVLSNRIWLLWGSGLVWARQFFAIDSSSCKKRFTLLEINTIAQMKAAPPTSRS